MATDPVLGSEFHEREDVLNLLTKRLTAFKQGYRQNMALIGPRAVGKSSILNRFLFLAQDSSIIPIFIDVPADGSLDLFIKRVMGGSLRGLLKSKGEDLPWDVTELIQRAKKYIPKTVRHMRAALKLANLGRNDEAYREVLAIPRILREEVNARAILVLDSFSHLEMLPIRDPFGIFGKEIMVDKDTMYLVASSYPVKAKSIFREKLNILFGNFEIFEIKNFDFVSATQIIHKRLNSCQVDRTFENFLIQMTDAHPFYLNVIVRRIEDLIQLSGVESLTQEIIFQAFIDEILCATGKIHTHFQMLLPAVSRSKNYLNPIQILSAIAQGNRKIPQLAKFLGCKISDTQKSVQKLLEEEIIQKEGALIIVPDTLFRFWLKHVVTLGQLGLETEIGRREEYFKRELEVQLGIYREAMAKDLPKRVEELLGTFANEIISIGSSKILCPSFQEIISKPTNGRVFPVFAKSSKGSWLCQIASQLVKEEDIRVFLEDVKKQGSKVFRKVVVALSGIDLNATLMAKDSKIYVWDLKNFNRLLEIYDRPKVIL